MPAQTSIAAVVASASIPDSKVDAIPDAKVLANLKTASRAKFLEGYSLIQAGKTDAARIAFDAALDMLDNSGWELSQIAPLSTFYWELAEQIKDAEAAYLYAPEDLQNDDEEYDDDGERFVGILSDEEFQNLGVQVRDDPVLKQALTDAYWTQFDIPIDVNDTVASSLDYLLNRGRKFFADGLVRSGRYRPLIEQVFVEEKLPLDLISLAHVESAFKTQALSKANAKGIWQFGKGTAVRYGLKVTADIDERSDP
ncbi:MAG: transglycosylase SLT domain-containing protein, partial [Acidobacteriota bacterium]|nr:transglycosylase SLT domain-containing protein [Acidobacteriota bacterium]